jgi:hypothetical protein
MIAISQQQIRRARALTHEEDHAAPSSVEQLLSTSPQGVPPVELIGHDAPEGEAEAAAAGAAAAAAAAGAAAAAAAAVAAAASGECKDARRVRFDAATLDASAFRKETVAEAAAARVSVPSSLAKELQATSHLRAARTFSSEGSGDLELAVFVTPGKVGCRCRCRCRCRC